MTRAIRWSVLLFVYIELDVISGNITVSPALPEVNRTAILSCNLLSLTQIASRYWIPPSTVTGQVICNTVKCSPAAITGYIFKADSTKIEVVIESLNRSRDGMEWTCSNGSLFTYRISLSIYTLPHGLDITQSPNTDVDLSISMSTLQCRTSSCTYPEPSIQWLYKDQPDSSTYKVYTRATPVGMIGPCAPLEMLYTSTLVLPQNTTLSDNSDKTVILTCNIEYPGVSTNISASGTNTVRFAVRITQAILQENNKDIASPLFVTSEKSVILTCVTGTSRPAPIVDWYIGSQWKGSGTNLNYIPNDVDHNQIIYCKAYNTDPNQAVTSSTPKIYVRVRVTEAVLQQNGQTISNSTLIVTSGKQTILSCVTGSSRPDANIEWYIGSQKRGSGTSLNFIPTNEDHNKAIYCQAYNIDPNQPALSNKPILFVRAAPKILDVSPSYKGYVGQYTIIQFDLYTNTDENLTVTAQHSNSSGLIHQGIIRPSLPDDLQVYSSQITAPVFRATLAISMRSTNDFGLYAIEVKNVIGSDSKDIKIIEQITPEKPSNFHASNVQEKQLSLTWHSGFHGGFTQTFVVEISLDNITWINVSEVSAGNKDGWFSTTVGNLIPGSEYYLRLYAYNIHGRGDFADVQLVIRMLKESAYPSSLDVRASAGIGVGGAVGIGVGGIVLGLIGAIIAFTIRKRLNGPTNSCFRSIGKTDDEMQTYSNTEMNQQTVKPIYEELNKGNTERSVYDNISPL